jgi:hypothetical protein
LEAAIAMYEYRFLVEQELPTSSVLNITPASIDLNYSQRWCELIDLDLLRFAFALGVARRFSERMSRSRDFHEV